MVTVLPIAVTTSGTGTTWPWPPASGAVLLQIVSPLQFLSLALGLLVVGALFAVLLMVLILWGTGVELPGLSHALKRISGRRPTGPWLSDVLGGATPLAFVFGGMVVLWVALAVGLWAYTQVSAAPAVAESPAPAVQPPPSQPSPTPAAQASQPTPPPAPAAQAAEPSKVVEDILINSGCAGCHTLQGVSGMTGAVGPELTRIGAVASQRIQDPNYTGSATTPAEYIRESIVDPNTYVVEGFPPVMPADFGTLLSPEELDLLVEYLASLE
ncbi:MAG: c-type cytochrome [Ardenticatenia bacterium]|nr:c-type cytochrome [Ardenticatenia bacterium]